MRARKCLSPQPACMLTRREEFESYLCHNNTPSTHASVYCGCVVHPAKCPGYAVPAVLKNMQHGPQDTRAGTQTFQASNAASISCVIWLCTPTLCWLDITCTLQCAASLGRRAGTYNLQPLLMFDSCVGAQHMVFIKQPRI